MLFDQLLDFLVRKERSVPNPVVQVFVRQTPGVGLARNIHYSPVYVIA